MTRRETKRREPGLAVTVDSLVFVLVIVALALAVMTGLLNVPTATYGALVAFLAFVLKRLLPHR